MCCVKKDAVDQIAFSLKFQKDINVIVNGIIMRNRLSLFSLLLFAVMFQPGFAQMHQSGLFFGSSANLLWMDGTGKMGDLDLNVTDDLIYYSENDKSG